MIFSRIPFKSFLQNHHPNSWLSVTAAAIVLIFSACSKDDDDKRPSFEDGRSKVVYDLPGDLETSMGTANAPPDKIKGQFQTFLFTFNGAKQHKPGKGNEAETDWNKLQKSADWDLAFTGPYNSEIYINNASQEKNPGYGGAATNTAVVLIKDSYENITEAPSDEAFDKSTIGLIGWSAIANDNGWFQYSDQTHIMKALPNRTYVIRLQNGKYAKLQIISAYKGYPPAITDLNWPAPYYTFRYYVQEDGSKDLRTK
ncbi:HmuY family protein [Sphingobacterium sp. UT-1RO-CII-1]|uniref:HmuY family protein n=1 Tax=Sphingobacterium sp. UT-1RO-CII-1 TaxID=2995225 RepID=UPI00227BB0AF|nr:HmuY family protein [Sphingobacterium sp. UT-1RO-CII-1]MCY4779807.1 HmuY family protein [Sphingobacterium sp. UT-1RO-CII-1]